MNTQQRREVQLPGANPSTLKLTVDSKEEERQSEVVKTVTKTTHEIKMSVETCLMHYCERYAAYCLCLAEVHWKMLAAEKAMMPGLGSATGVQFDRGLRGFSRNVPSPKDS